MESAQYLLTRYTEHLALAEIDTSVGMVGNSYDNALAETINGLYKAEVIHHLGPWKSMAQVEWETLKWVDWYNNRCLPPKPNEPSMQIRADLISQPDY